MNKQAVLNRLMALPAEIEAAEQEVVNAQWVMQVTKDTLADREAELMVTGQIDGKNAEQRAAQLRTLTAKERTEVANAENKLAIARARLNALHVELKALRSVAGVLANGEVA